MEACKAVPVGLRKQVATYSTRMQPRRSKEPGVSAGHRTAAQRPVDTQIHAILNFEAWDALDGRAEGMILKNDRSV